MAWLSSLELSQMGFASFGENVLISDKASLYNCKNITIGNHVRIDDFCVLSAGENGIFIENHIHIAVYSSLIGAGKITLSSFSNISSRVSIYSNNDDYSGNYLTNPTISNKYTNVNSEAVFVGKHVIVGSGSVILPGVVLEEGVAIGALSLVSKNCSSFGIYAGIPAKKIKERNRNLLDIEAHL
jgi:galactoside O-acetyltransferase